MKFHIISLGCQMNISDSERVKTMLMQMGYEETMAEDEADIVGVMACSVRQKAIDKIYSLIHKWEKWKKKKSLVTFVSGCILPADREKFLKRFDLLFSINELPEFPDMLRQYGVHTGYSAKSEVNAEIDLEIGTNLSSTNAKESLSKGFWQIAPSYSSSYDAFVTIQNGCDKFCTFCAVPYTRGREVSRPSSEILQEVFALMQKGYKSITLLGQNVNSYGIDTEGKELSFAQLLARIGNMAEELDHDCWIYFTSPHPRDMTRDVLETVAKYPALAKQINLPLQSGDDKLLMRMNRNHSMSRYDYVVQEIREILPEATLFTDIIVGFCGESDAQFENTVSAMKKYGYSMAYIAMYSPRPGATSSRWKDDVSLETKKQRFRMLSELLKESAQNYNRKLVGSTIKILVEKIHKPKDGRVLLAGKNEGRIPVQIEVHKDLSQKMSPNCLAEDFACLIGTFVYAKATRIHSLSLECTLDALPNEALISHTAQQHTSA